MLIRHVVAYLFARGLPGVVNFLALAVYTRLLSQEDFGRYSLVLAAIGLIHVVVFQWLQLVCGRFLPAHIDQPQIVLRPILAIFLLLSAVFVCIACIGSLVWAAPEWYPIIPVAITWTVVQAWHELNLRLTSAQLNPVQYGMLSAIKAVLALLLGALLAWLFHNANAPLLGLIFGAVTAWLIAGRSTWSGIRPQLPTREQFKEFSGYGLPLAITFSLVWVTSSSDRMVIAWFLGEAQTGIYAVGYDMAQQSLGLLLSIVNTAATPLAIKALEKEGIEAARQQIRQNGELMFALAFSGAAGLIAIEPAMIGLFVGEEFREGASTVFMWIALTAAIIGIKSFHFDIAFHLTRKSKWLLITSGLAAIANLGLNLVFVPYFGIVGAAWAALLAYSVAAVSSAIIGFRVFPMPKILPLLARGIVLAAGVYWSAWLCMQMDISLAFKMISSVLVAGIVAVVICLLLDVSGARQLAGQHGHRLFKDLFKKVTGMIDVSLFVPSLRGGGAERAMVTLANGFAERGLKVDLVLASAEGPYLSEVSSGVNIIDLKSSRVLASLPGLVRYLRKVRPEAMLSALSHANVIATLACMLARTDVRLVVSERSNLSMSSSKPQNLRGRAVLPLMRWVYRKADGVVAVSKGVADDLAKNIDLPRDRISVIYNPVVTSGLIEKSRMPLEHLWLREGKPPVILGVGRLTPAKDFATLIRAFAQVRAQRECHLVILGEGELRAELEQLITSLGIVDSVQLPGFTENPFAWMSRVQLFVLSSRWEGLPNVLIQAMACGAAVVSTNCPSGPDEILEDGRWGKLVSVGDVEALAGAIVATLDTPQERLPDVRQRSGDFAQELAVDGYLKVLRLMD